MCMSAISNAKALAESAAAGASVPEDLSAPLKALWLTEADQWDAAHDIAQDLNSKMGDWIHALLHLIEGDIGNSEYWYHRAGKRQPSSNEIGEEWQRIAEAAFAEQA